jgi:uncharacterized protein YggU (UPF0235/DUF167 family)
MFIKIKVKTGSRTEKVEKKADDLYFVSVKEEAERNLANKRVLEIMRALYPKKSVKLVKGHHSPTKIIEVNPG